MAGYKGATCGGANHSPIHFPSTTVQTLGIRISSIPCPPHYSRALCSIHGIKRVTIISFRVPSVLQMTPGLEFYAERLHSLPHRSGDTAVSSPRPVQKKPFDSQAPANHHPNPAYPFLSYPFTPFRIRDTRSFTKEAATVEDCFDLTPRSRSEGPTLGSFAGRRAGTSRPARVSGRTHHRGTGVLPEKDV